MSRPDASKNHRVLRTAGHASSPLHKSGALLNSLQGGIIVAVILLCATIVFAATHIDTLDADFTAGNETEVNVTSDTFILPLTIAGVYNTSGTFYSQVFDLGSNPSATINWSYATPTGTSVLVSTRSGNNTVAGSTGWGSWSSDYATSTGSTVTSTQARYYQYRVQMASTNNSSTPTISDVTLIYTEANTSISSATGSNTNLTDDTSGTYRYYITVTDTYTIQNVTGIYRLYSGSTAGSYSSEMNWTWSSANTYYLNVSEPGSGWDSYGNTTDNGTLEFEIAVASSNGSTTFTVNETINETIEFVNTVPVTDPVSNYTIAQSDAMNFTVTGSDADNQTITYTTNASYVTVTNLSTTSARLTWTTNSSQIGYHAIIISANDTMNVTNTTFYVNVTDVNDAPTIEDVDAITGYHGIKQLLVLTATDADSGAELTFSMDPAFFSITTNTTYDNVTATTGTYYGLANFTPADEEDGVHNVTFFVTDGEDTVNTSTTMTIDYCGDLTCQTDYESSATCAIDCAEATLLDYVSLITPDRNCVDEPMTVYTFNASNRYNCYYKGLVEQGNALCDAIDGASITAYYRNESLLTEVASLSSGTNGSATFTPDTVGEYKFSVEADEFANSSAFVYIRECSNDIVVYEQNVTVNQSDTSVPRDRNTEKPLIENPDSLAKSGSLLSILMFYFVIPTLLAMLVYTSFVFYDVNKDTLPWILEMRIFFYEKRTQYAPQITAIKKKTDPIVIPIIQSVQELYARTLAPLVDKLKNMRKKP